MRHAPDPVICLHTASAAAERSVYMMLLEGLRDSPFGMLTLENVPDQSAACSQELAVEGRKGTT